MTLQPLISPNEVTRHPEFLLTPTAAHTQYTGGVGEDVEAHE
jgi:hypothetical protein